MIAKEEFDYIRSVVDAALSKGVTIEDQEEGRRLAIVDPEAVLSALDGAWEALVPPSRRA